MILEWIKSHWFKNHNSSTSRSSPRSPSESPNNQQEIQLQALTNINAFKASQELHLLSLLFNQPSDSPEDMSSQSIPNQSTSSHPIASRLTPTLPTSDKSAQFIKLISSLLHESQKQGSRYANTLPRQPSSLPLLIKILNDDNCSREKLSKAVLADPSLTEQILKTANTPFFKVSNRPIESVDQAIFLMGSEGIRNLISATLMTPVMRGKDKDEQFFCDKIWQWALCTASTTDTVYRISGAQRSSYFLLGLLPALSWLVIYRMAVKASKGLKIDSLEALELYKHVIISNQWKVAHALANAWGLPENYHKALIEAESAPNSSLLFDSVVLSTNYFLKKSDRPSESDNGITPFISIDDADTKNIREHFIELNIT